MNTLLLQPNDVLFFRDGRPMTGASTGHGAAWPLPHVLNAAFHAALHRAFVEVDNDGRTVARVGKSHAPAYRKDAQRFYAEDEPDRHFTDLQTAGPFPVKDDRWYFPRPGDAQIPASHETTLQPYRPSGASSNQARPSSLPMPLEYTVADTRLANKEKPEAWFS